MPEHELLWAVLHENVDDSMYALLELARAAAMPVATQVELTRQIMALHRGVCAEMVDRYGVATVLRACEASYAIAGRDIEGGSDRRANLEV